MNLQKKWSVLLNSDSNFQRYHNLFSRPSNNRILTEISLLVLEFIFILRQGGGEDEADNEHGKNDLNHGARMLGEMTKS